MERTNAADQVGNDRELPETHEVNLSAHAIG